MMQVLTIPALVEAHIMHLQKHQIPLIVTVKIAEKLKPP
jgi:hypothetical protein